MNGMKDSGVEWIGEIPHEWSITRYKFQCDIQSGFPFESNKFSSESGVPLIRIRDITSGKIETFYQGEYSDEFIVKPGDCLIAMDGDFNIRWWEGEEALLNQRCCRLVCEDDIKRRFLFYSLPLCLKILNALAYSTTVKHLSVSDIGNSYVTIPDPTVQKKIVEFLNSICSSIDSIIENIQKEIKLLDEYKKSIITETVTKGVDLNVPMRDSGVEWIGKIPEGWSIVRLKELFKIKKEIAGIDGYDILSVTQNGIIIKNIETNEGQISQDYSKYQIVNPGDFVMNHMDLITGYVDLSDKTGVTSPDYRVFKPINNLPIIDRYYLYIFQACYKNKIFYGLGQGVSKFGRWRLPADNFLNFNLPVPPLNQQKEIASYLDLVCLRVKNSSKNYQMQIELLGELKQSIIFEFVTGKRQVEAES